MKITSKKRFFERLFVSRIFIVSLVVAAAFVAFGFARAYYQNYKIRQEVNTLRADIEALKQKKFESMDFLSYVLSPGYVEEKARTELNMKKPDEHVAIIGASGAIAVADANASLREDGSRQKASNPLKWWYYFWAARE